jgi:hypothetical protein
VLSYATLLGGAGSDYVNDIALDASGAAYLAGLTDSDGFPTTSGAYDTTRSGTDAFVTKLNPAGTALVYSTLLGGSETDAADSIAVDASGQAVVVGQTASNRASATQRFPTTAGAFVTADDTGFGDVFVTRLNAAGNGLVFSSAFGGSYRDEARAVAVDASGGVYVGGYTQSTGNAPVGFPASSGSFQAAPGGTSDDGFVAKLDAVGARVYATYLGGTGQDTVNGIDVDSTGRAYVTGFAAGGSQGNGFPTTPANRFADVDADGTDAFLSVLSATGTALTYSSGIGADGASGNDGSDYGYGVAVGATDGIAYITGASRVPPAGKADFPLKLAFQGRPGGCCFALDAFVAKFDTSAAGAASLLYSTLLGGNGEDSLTAIDVDAAGNAYVAGTTYFESGTFYPTTPDELGGGTNRGRVVVTELVQAGSAPVSLGFSTTVQGTSALDGVGGLVHDPAAGAVHVGGTSRSGSLATTPGAYQTVGAGDRDGFAATITVSSDATPPDTTITSGPPEGSTASTAQVTFGFSATESSTFECAYDAAAFAPCSTPGPGLTGSDTRTLSSGPHTVAVRARDGAGNVDATPATRGFTVSAADTTPPDTTITSGPAQGATLTSASVTFGFSATESSTFECAYDAGAFAPCTGAGPGTAGSDTRSLADGPHTFAVRARDTAGNADPSPATRSFSVAVPSPPPVDTTPPDTVITQAPPARVKVKRKATVSVQFTATEAGARFTCRVDGGPAQACTSGATFRLGKGRHTITITAVDAAGNADPTPASVPVTVKKKPKPEPGARG